MPTQPTVPGRDAKFAQAAFGAQGPLIIATVPSGAAAGLIGTLLVDAGALTVAGVYNCLVPLAGCVSTCEVHLTATIAAGTASSAVDTLYWVRDPQNSTNWATKTSATGDGSLTTTELQTSTISTLAGEQYALVAITLATSPNVTFTRAEFNGL